MADEERKNPGLIQEVSPSELGQLSPGFTPTNQERQGWGREQAIGMAESNTQDHRQSSPPELTFADTGTEDLSAAGRESAVHLDQNQLDSIEQTRFAEREREAAQEQTNVPEQHRNQRELEATQEKDNDHDR